MTLTRRFAIPIAAASIAITALVAPTPASAATTYCPYKVVNAPNGFRTFHGGWANAAYLTRIPGTTCGE